MSLSHFLLHLLSQICSHKTVAAVAAHVFSFQFIEFKEQAGRRWRLLTGFLRHLSSYMSFFAVGFFPRPQIIARNKCEQLLCTFTHVLFMFSPLTFFMILTLCFHLALLAFS